MQRPRPNARRHLAAALAVCVLLPLASGAQADDAAPPSWRGLVRQTASAFAQPGDLGLKREAVQALVSAGREDAWMILLAALEQEGRHLDALVEARRAAWDRTVDLWRMPRPQHHFEHQRLLGTRFEDLAGADLGWFREAMLVGQMEMRLRGAPEPVRSAYLMAASSPGPRLHPNARRAVASLAGPGLASPREASEFRELLERDPDERVRLAALAALPEQGPFAVPLRMRRLRDASWVVRMSAARDLARLRCAEAVPLLEAARAHAGPREADALAAALRDLGAPAAAPDPGIPFLGGSLRSDRLVFVLDTSAAAAPTWPKVRAAVLAAIDALPEEARFGLVAYDGAVDPWRDAPVEASAQARAEARAWLEARTPDWNACLGGALRQAFRMAGLAPDLPGDTPVDTFVVVAAAAPTLYAHDAAERHDPEELLRLVSAWNRDARIRIDTYAVAAPARPVLEALAAAHDGRFHAP